MKHYDKFIVSHKKMLSNSYVRNIYIKEELQYIFNF